MPVPDAGADVISAAKSGLDEQLRYACESLRVRTVIHIHLATRRNEAEVTFRVFSFHLYFGRDTESTHTSRAQTSQLNWQEKATDKRRDKDLGDTHNDRRRKDE